MSDCRDFLGCFALLRT